MYSCNVPVPSSVSRLARGLAAELFDATRRDRHTLVLKRLDDGDPRILGRQVREALEGFGPVAARVTEVDAFWDPPTDPAPVVYLRVESPGIQRLHRRLCERFEPVGDIEGETYVPHVTIARGGDADRLVGREVDIEWTVDTVFVWSPTYGEPVERISLPA